MLLRSIYRGRVRWTFPYHVVEERSDGFVLALCLGTPGKIQRRDAEGRYLDRWVADGPPDDHVWERTTRLSIVRFGDAYCIDLFWENDVFLGWYVNLQSPVVRSPLGLDTMDHALDIEIEPDGTWSWKDEDDFAEAQTLGVFTPAEAAAVRAEGERVIEAWPFPTGWEEFKPDPAWAIPSLPDGWDRV